MVTHPLNLPAQMTRLLLVGCSSDDSFLFVRAEFCCNLLHQCRKIYLFIIFSLLVCCCAFDLCLLSPSFASCLSPKTENFSVFQLSPSSPTLLTNHWIKKKVQFSKKSSPWRTPSSIFLTTWSNAHMRKDKNDVRNMMAKSTVHFEMILSPKKSVFCQVCSHDSPDYQVRQRSGHDPFSLSDWPSRSLCSFCQFDSVQHSASRRCHSTIIQTASVIICTTHIASLRPTAKRRFSSTPARHFKSGRVGIVLLLEREFFQTPCVIACLLEEIPWGYLLHRILCKARHGPTENGK